MSAVFSSLAGYQRPWLRGDLIAGLTVWAVLVPEALAYATIAGVSPVVGLYAAPAALLLYAAFGSSRHLVVGPMSATAALSAAAVGDIVAPAEPTTFLAMTVALGLIVGLIALVAGLAAARLPRQLHLRAGAQGLHHRPRPHDHRRPAARSCSASTKVEGDFFEQLLGLPGHARRDAAARRSRSASSRWSIVARAAARRRRSCPGRWSPSCSASPRSQLFDLDDAGRRDRRADPGGLPTLGLPDGRARRLPRRSSAGAVGVMLVGFAEGLGAAKTYAARDHYDIDPNRELIGARRGQPRRRARQRDGRQRQPVEDRGQRRAPAPGPSCPAWSSPC